MKTNITLLFIKIIRKGFILIMFLIVCNSSFAQEDEFGLIEAKDIPVLPVKAEKMYNGNYLIFGIGGISSYGGLGAKIQLRIGGEQGVGFQAGIGSIIFSDDLCYSAGIKYFFYKDLYINGQYGFIDVKSAPGFLNFRSNPVYGPSLLLGGDISWGKTIGFGFNFAFGVSYNDTKTFDYYGSNKFKLAIDIGFIVRFDI